MPKRNVYDTLSRQQILDVVDLVSDGIADRLHLIETEESYTQEDIDGIRAKIARGQEAIDLMAGDLIPQYASQATLAQLNVLDITNYATPETDTSLEALQHAARNVLGFLGDLENGYQPGAFVQSLLTTFTRADSDNQIRLAQAFPVYGAVWLMHYKAGGTDGLRALLPAKIQ